MREKDSEHPLLPVKYADWQPDPEKGLRKIKMNKQKNK